MSADPGLTTPYVPSSDDGTMVLFAPPTTIAEPEAPGVTRVAMVKGDAPKLSSETDLLLAIRQHHMTLVVASAGRDLHGAARGSMILAIMLMFLYAMFIPNTWRSAARVILAFAIMPLAVKIAVLLTHPAIFRTELDTA